MLIRLPKRQLAVLVAIWAAAATVVALLVSAGRDVALERSERFAAAFARIAEQQATRTFQAVNLTLAAVADAHALEPRLAKNDGRFQAMMTHRLKDVPFVRAIFIIGAEGRLIHDTDYPRTPDVSLADRAYFNIHRLDPHLERALSAPILSRSNTGWFVAVTHRLSRTGTFEGVVVAAIQADELRRQYEALGLGRGDALALFHRDGTLIAHHPAGGGWEVGQSLAHLPLFAEHLPESNAGTFSTARGMYSGRQMVGYRTVEGTPYAVRVSRSDAAALAEWRRTAIGASVAMGTLTLLLLLFGVYVVREHAREERARERREQAEKLEALGLMASGIAHDFGNMLSVISMNLSVLREHARGSAPAREAFTLAERTLGLGADLIERLLGFARGRPLTVIEVDLNRAVASAAAFLHSVAGPRVEISVELEPGLPTVRCDPGKLEVTLVNLVANARDAMQGTGRIVLRTYASAPDLVCVCVQDSGPGMREDVRRRIFEPFFTTKGSAGTGLGLSQAYGFMQQIAGSVRIDSAPGAGTTVHLCFPPAGTGSQ
jgi:signal transduction histidine kinase